MTNAPSAVLDGIYGQPLDDLATPPASAAQFSPLIPGSRALEAEADGALASMVLVAPPGTLERRYILALALRKLAPGAELIALAPKDKGGARLKAELEAMGCVVAEAARRHHRICTVTRPAALVGLDATIAEGEARFLPALGFTTQPGVFSWDRIDAGTALLIGHLPRLAGRGADLGCGIGVLARAALASSAVSHLALVDLDRRALDAAKANLGEDRVSRLWADLRQPQPDLKNLDFVVTNPPFHDGGAEDKALGQTFVRRAADMLKNRGSLWLVANRHLPYEAVLAPLFKTVALKAETGGYKIYEATK